MKLSADAAKKLAIAMSASGADAAKANEVVDKLNQADALWSAASHTIAAAIVATSVSATTDFAALKAGDLLIAIPATPGSAGFESVATDGTKPSAAVVGDLYIALRAKAAPAASNIIF